MKFLKIELSIGVSEDRKTAMSRVINASKILSGWTAATLFCMGDVHAAPKFEQSPECLRAIEDVMPIYKDMSRKADRRRGNLQRANAFVQKLVTAANPPGTMDTVKYLHLVFEFKKDNDLMVCGNPRNLTKSDVPEPKEWTFLDEHDAVRDAAWLFSFNSNLCKKPGGQFDGVSEVRMGVDAPAGTTPTSLLKIKGQFNIKFTAWNQRWGGGTDVDEYSVDVLKYYQAPTSFEPLVDPILVEPGPVEEFLLRQLPPELEKCVDIRIPPKSVPHVSPSASAVAPAPTLTPPSVLFAPPKKEVPSTPFVAGAAAERAAPSKPEPKSDRISEMRYSAEDIEHFNDIRSDLADTVSRLMTPISDPTLCSAICVDDTRMGQALVSSKPLVFQGFREEELFRLLKAKCRGPGERLISAASDLTDDRETQRVKRSNSCFRRAVRGDEAAAKPALSVEPLRPDLPPILVSSTAEELKPVEYSPLFPQAKLGSIAQGDILHFKNSLQIKGCERSLKAPILRRDSSPWEALGSLTALPKNACGGTVNISVGESIKVSDRIENPDGTITFYLESLSRFKTSFELIVNSDASIADLIYALDHSLGDVDSPL